MTGFLCCSVVSDIASNFDAKLKIQTMMYCFFYFVESEQEIIDKNFFDLSQYL